MIRVFRVEPGRVEGHPVEPHFAVQLIDEAEPNSSKQMIISRTDLMNLKCDIEEELRRSR